jgi:DNA (cytosine-5)-methyltransferase 1
LHKAGFKIIGALDNWDKALNTFVSNHPQAKIFKGNIQNIQPSIVLESLYLEKGELDCLIGGPPCQGFSKNVPAIYRFLEDDRNQLFNDYLKYVATFLPKVVVLENVAEIFNAFDGQIIPKNNWFAKITWNKVGEIQNIADFPDDFFRK